MNVKMTFLLLVAASIKCFAQPVITAAEMPVPGTTWIFAYDFNHVAPVTAGGSNMTWDYSGLINTGSESVAFQSASATPYSSLFPLANLATNNGAGTWSYYASGTQGLTYHGDFDSAYGITTSSLPYYICPAPFTYNDTSTRSSVSQNSYSANGINYLEIDTVVSFFQADGYGTLILPAGVFNNVLRIRITEHSNYYQSEETAPGSGIYTLTNSGQEQSIFYRYFRTGTPYSFLLSVFTDSSGANENGAYFSVNNPNVSTNDVSSHFNELTAFPIPAAGTVTIEAPKSITATSIEVYSVDGRVNTLPISGKDGRYSFDCSSLANGSYLFGMGEYRGRITVNH